MELKLKPPYYNINSNIQSKAYEKVYDKSLSGTRVKVRLHIISETRDQINFKVNTRILNDKILPYIEKV